MSQGNGLRIDSSLRLPAADGFRLAATLYEPGEIGQNGDAVVLINPATAAPRGYYDAFARFLAGRGFSVLTYDYRGMGESRPRSLRGFKARMRDWGEQDMAGMVDWTVRHLQPSRLLVVGHSVGGQIVGLAENNGKVDALLGVAAQNGYYGHWPASARFGLALRWYLMVPAVSLLFGYVPGRLGIKEDLPGGVAREWAAWCRRPGFLLEGHEERRRGFDRFTRPILAYSFADDGYAPRPAVESLLGLYRNASVTHHHIAPGEAGGAIGHFGFFKERFRATLWQDAAQWLEEQAGMGKAAVPPQEEMVEPPVVQVA
ncbi:MAG TPA: alpha/beta fold hydrolase [Thermoanaerobaculia bacterium]|nr:alpha/beta fold hydrolase [Thermoanaerobaculia bacterium]